MIAFILARKRRAHIGHRKSGNRCLPGAASLRQKQARHRLLILIGGFALFYVVIALRLFQYGLASPLATASIGPGDHYAASRPDIVDRNGELLATDLNMVSLYAEPRRIVDADEVVEKLGTVLPAIDWSDIHKKLRSKTAFQLTCH